MSNTLVEFLLKQLPWFANQHPTFAKLKYYDLFKFLALDNHTYAAGTKNKLPSKTMYNVRYT